MNRRARIAIAAGCLLLLAGAGSALWRASPAIGVAERDVASSGRFPFVLSERRPVTTGIERISAPAEFSDATVYKGRIYTAGPGGLFTEGIDYRVGDLLPPAPLSSMAQAITSQSADPELWIGTAGEGLLAFDGMRFRHLRPVDARARNVTAVLGLGVGRVLFGTEKAGVLTYDGKSLTPYMWAPRVESTWSKAVAWRGRLLRASSSDSAIIVSHDDGRRVTQQMVYRFKP